ncbi:MAG: hypothetical protein AAGA11_02105 [Pseudomonadota bacterium]
MAVLGAGTSLVNSIDWVDATLDASAPGNNACETGGGVVRGSQGHTTTLHYHGCTATLGGQSVTLRGEAHTNCVDHSGACVYALTGLGIRVSDLDIELTGDARRIDSDSARSLDGSALSVTTNGSSAQLNGYTLHHDAAGLDALEGHFHHSGIAYTLDSSTALSLPTTGCLQSGEVRLTDPTTGTVTITPYPGGNLSVASPTGSSTLNCSEVTPWPPRAAATPGLR